MIHRKHRIESEISCQLCVWHLLTHNLSIQLLGHGFRTEIGQFVNVMVF